jgi:hypothetical protein
MEIKGEMKGGVTINKEVHGDAVMLVGDEALKAKIEELEDENAHQLRYMQFLEETLNETGALIESTVINPAEGE